VSAVRGSASLEAAYYQTVEEFFVSRRGDPLILSSADWTLVHKWHEAGVPLRVVLRGLADALDAHAHSWSRERKVGSLAYCAAEVELARERWQRAVALGAEEGGDVPGWLRGLADALERVRLGPRASVLAPKLSRALRDRAEAPGAAEALEAWLLAGERELREALAEDAGPDTLSMLEREVDGDLAAYRERMPTKVLDQIRAESLTRRLLESSGLPRLSLFHRAP
jgi:hypothetical protein